MQVKRARALAVALGIAGIAAALALHRPRAAPSPPARAADPPPSAAAPIASDPPPAPDAEPPPAPDLDASPAAPRVHTVVLDGSPDSAMGLRDGVTFPLPAAIEVAEGAHVVVRVHADGYRMQKVTLDGSALDVFVKLEPGDDEAPPLGEGALTRAEIDPVVARRSPLLRRACKALGPLAGSDGGPASARVRAVLTIGPAGAVTAVRATGAEQELPGLAGCVAEQLRQWRFRAAGESLTLAIPFVFVAP